MLEYSWAADASDITIGDNLDSLIYTNRVLEDFVRQDAKCVLTGNKGMGKTLMLTFKRYMISKKHKGDVLCVPLNHPYLDFMEDLPALDRRWKECFGTVDNAKTIWRLAIQLSAFAHWAKLRNESAVDTKIPSEFLEWIDGANPMPPTIVCHGLMKHPPSQLFRQYDRSSATINAAFRSIQSSIYFFIDRVDQASDSLSREAWINFQVGLALAVTDLRNANSHVKAFVTIRQEAYSNHSGPTRANLASSVTEIRYNKSDVRAIIDQLTSCIEGQGFDEFIGIGAVYNDRASCYENAYDYMFRHTIGRPRDLVRIAEALSHARISSKTDKSDRETVFKEIVNEKSTEIIGQEVFAEVRVFLDALRDDDERGRLFGMLPHNILTRDEVVQIASAYNGSPTSLSFDSKGPQHPFCELYNAGLLGVLRNAMTPGRVSQKFKQPRDPFNPFSTDLPYSNFYFVHSGLCKIIEQSNDSYRMYRYVPVGEECAWGVMAELVVAAQRELGRIMDDGVVQQRLGEAGFRKFYELVMEALRLAHTNDWKADDARSRKDKLMKQMGPDWRHLMHVVQSWDEFGRLEFLLESAIAGEI